MNNFFSKNSKLNEEEISILEWILAQYENHPFLTEVLDQLKKIDRIYSKLEDRSKLIYDLSQCEFWNSRTLAGNENSHPIYWDPTEENYNSFLKRCNELKLTAKTYEKNEPFPPQDIILVKLTALKNTEYKG